MKFMEKDSAFCPDQALDIEKDTFADYVYQMEDVAGFEFKCIKCIRRALTERIGAFAESGCKTADHTLARVPYGEAPLEELTAIFKKGLAGEALTEAQIDAYKTDLLLTCAREYAKRGMVMQLHAGDDPEGNLARLTGKLESEGLKPEIVC